MLVALVCAALVAFATADTVEDYPFKDAIITGKGNQLTAKYPAEEGITLVIIHMSDESSFTAPNGGKWSTPIITQPKDNFYSSTVTANGLNNVVGLDLKYWIRIEKNENGKSVGHNSSVRKIKVAPE